MTSIQEFNCIFCKESFCNKEELQIHFRKHGDPKFNQKVKSRSHNESQTSTEKRNEIAEMVNCDVCNEVFPTISKAITHKHKFHPDHDAKYFCPWCGKLFTMKHLFNKHLQSTHDKMEKSDNINFHCDVCNVDFFIATAMLYHNKFFHRQDIELPSIGQSKKFKNINQEMLLIYYCAFCGEEYDNKVNLHKHMADEHGDENQSPDDVLRCPLCDAIFYHLDAYELHLTFHSTDDLYSEKNEIFEQIEEFSLETVPPIMERVENFAPQDVKTAMNAIGLETFLETAMDHDNDKHKKSKKHKKHKKSKKPAITLDEFLNMNADVFGEGLDFQGIEEVPTQVIAKRLKQKKANKPTGSLKVLEGSELEKLKKQGVIVKMKHNKMPQLQNFKIGMKIENKSKEVSKQNNSKIPNIQSQTPNEVLSKLLNQSNSQIKIVKKQHQNTDESRQVNMPHSDTSAIKRGTSPENIEVECDVMQSGYTSSETETKEECAEQDKQSDENGTQMVLLSCDNREQNEKQDICNEFRKSCDHYGSNKDTRENTLEKITKISNMNNLKNISQNVTIKSLCTTLNNTESQKCNNDDILADKHDTSEGEESRNDDSHKPLLTNTDNTSRSSLDALKHLSHMITVKSINSKILVAQPKKEAQKTLEPVEMETFKSTQREPLITPRRDDKNTSPKPMDCLKPLNKNSTVKSIIPSQYIEERFSSDEELGTENLKILPNQSSPLKNFTVQNIESNVVSPKHSPKTKQINIHVLQGNISEQIESQNKNTNMLSRLANITAKPIGAIKNSESIVNKSFNNVQITPAKNIIKQNEKYKQVKEEIEIFNIDDSESEEDKMDTILPQSKPSNIVPTKNTSNVSLDKLKNLSNNVTVTSVNRQIIRQNAYNIVKREPNIEKITNQSQSSMSDFSDEDEDTIKPSIQKQTLHNSIIQNTLKNLGKHIIVKSRNSSPNTSVKNNKTINYSEELGENMPNSDSENDYTPGKVKITEIHDGDENEDGTRQEFCKISENCAAKENVQSPREFNSVNDNNANDDTDDELSDLESRLQATTIKKPILNTQGRPLNRDVTIKSINKGNSDSESSSSKNVPSFPAGLSIKSVKQNKSETDNNSTFNKNINPVKVARSTHQSVHHNVASNSQQNSVSKEVTVKTFQTKTIIEEITTTVTKTIKTVNQTMKQKLQTTSQSSKPIINQNIHRIGPNPHMKNIQGITVRNATPPTGTKVRGMTPARAPAGSAVRGCNQIVPVRQSNQMVPVRPVSNVIRATGPRMPNSKKLVTSTSTNQQNIVVGRQLKISPSAVNTTTKRPTEDTIGHFSCFKKPKESLIPVSDIPTFDNSHGCESSVQYTSSQSNSKYSSSTKTVKGNTIVTATQTKSETSSSSQHLSKLNSLSGLTVVKTNQSKQAMQVEEQCEVSASKRNTLEAIEKLQKQGLLVKKPRLGSNNDCDPSDEDDQYLSDGPNH